MNNKSKVETFIGFAMRTGKYKIGANACATLQRANLIIVCKTASENSKKEALKLAKSFHCKLYETVSLPLSEFTHRENAKIMAVADKSLAKAITDNSENDLIERTGD